MKIALIGTHGSGKTTLALYLTGKLKIERYHSAGLLTEVAGSCPLPINEERTYKSQLWIVATQIKREIELEAGYDILVCDRSVLDAYIYTLSKFGAEKTKNMEAFVKDWLPTYDLLLRVERMPEFLVQDDTRSVEKGFQKEIDDLIEDYLTENKIDHLRIPRETLKKPHFEEEVYKVIRNYLAKNYSYPK